MSGEYRTILVRGRQYEFPCVLRIERVRCSHKYIGIGIGHKALCPMPLDYPPRQLRHNLVLQLLHLGDLTVLSAITLVYILSPKVVDARVQYS